MKAGDDSPGPPAIGLMGHLYDLEDCADLIHLGGPCLRYPKCLPIKDRRNDPDSVRIQASLDWHHVKGQYILSVVQSLAIREDSNAQPVPTRLQESLGDCARRYIDSRTAVGRLNGTGISFPACKDNVAR